MKRERISLASTNNNNGSTGTSKPVNEVAVCDNEELTCINDDIPILTVTRPFPSVDTNDLCKSLCESRTHELKDILARPTLVQSFNWTTSQVPTTQIISNVSFPATFLSNTMIANKVSGFLGFKGRLVLTLQINPERFHQGRLIMNWFPSSTYATGARIGVANSRLVYSTQLPNVQFDAATNSTVQLKVDYVSPTVAYDLLDGEGQQGGVSVVVYSPLVTVIGSTTLACKLWAHYEDAELSFPIRPQSSKTISKRRNLVRDRKEVEELAAGVGPVSSILAATSIYASALSEVPILSSFVTPISWASAILAKTASSFGFSKPTISNPQKRVVSSKFPYAANSLGFDSSTNLGLFADAKIADYPNYGGTNIDEMHIQYLLQVPAHLISFSWSTSNPSDTTLWTTQLSPNVMLGTRTVGTLTVVDSTPLFFIGNLFALWRGSYTFVIKIAKTEFHSGRLIFAYEPNPVNIALTTTLSNYMYKEILDLRTANEFVVTVPYVSVHPYLEVQGTLQETCSGRVYLFVETPLQAPNTVASAVDIMVEVAGGPDFEFSVPTDPLWVPATFSGGPLPNIVDPGGEDEVKDNALLPKSEEFYPQSLGTSILPTMTQVSDDRSINNDSDSGGLTPSMLCIGEKIISVRQLLKRSVLHFTSETFGSLTTMVMSPTLISVCSIGTLGGTSGPLVKIDYINYLGLIYRYHRGSVVLKFYGDDAGENIYAGTLVPNAGFVGFPVQDLDVTTRTVGPVVFGATSLGGGIEMSVPNYSRWPFNPIYEHTLQTSTTPLPFAADHRVKFKTTQPMQRPRVFRHAGEDFAFGYFIGTVPLIQKLNVLIPSFGSWA